MPRLVTGGPLIPTRDVRRVAKLATIGRQVVHGVVEILGDISDSEATDYIRTILSKLRDDQFVETVDMDYARGDIYGVRNDEGDWYVKVIQRSGVTVVSCHRPERALRTVGGETIGGRR